ncbi:MAG: hypothetical protein L6R48_08250 [Planctomycetes bacterium]|nr:hypothetical protein [Planctomycetota bacterium]
MAATAPAASAATADRLLRAGALLPPATGHGRDLPTDAIDARVYRHPVLTDPVVQLTPAGTAAGDDLVMGFLGFAAPTVVPAVAQAVRRAPGFPAWALLNDPRHARHALAVVKEMKAAGRRVRSKPGHAWESYDAIAKQLGRSTAHFLPSYWEEVGRTFSEAGNSTYASRAFSQARAAEQVHSLRVDLAAQRASMLEFALRGAVSIKVLEDFARMCAKRDGAAAAWTGFRDLCLKRCQGGMPPWGAMLDHLLAMAGAAKADPEVERVRLLADLLPLPAVRQAPEAFWTAAKPALDRLAADPTWAGRLIDLAPTPPGKPGWYGTWARWLLDWDLVQPIAAGRLADGTPVAAGPWFERMARLCADGYLKPAPAAFVLSERLAPALIAAGVPLQLAGEHLVDLSLVELALELGIPLADPPEHTRIHLATWAGREAGDHPAQGRDPQRTAADPRFRPRLRAAVLGALDEPPTVAVLVQAPATLALARELVAEAISEAARGGLPGALELATWLEKNLLPPLRAALPELVAQVRALPLADCLARSLRGGLVDELGWPALEAAVARLRRQPDPRLHGDTGLPAVTGLAPFLVVHNGVRAEVVGPAGTVLACDLSRPAKATTMAVLYRGGRLLHAWSLDWQNRAFSWSHEPQVHHELKEYLHVRDSGVQIELPDGGTCTGRRAWRAGEARPPFDARRVVGDGRTLWTIGDDRSLHELDPATGDLGRASLPAFFEAWTGPGRTLDLARSSLHPHPGAGAVVCGRDGLVGLRAETVAEGVHVEALDGSSWRGPSRHPVALLRWPGDLQGRPRLLERDWGSTRIRSPEGWVSSLTDPAWSPGQPCPIPAECWPAMQVRDPAASALLRRFQDGDAAALLATALAELPEQAGDADDDDEAPPAAVPPRLAEQAAGLLPGHQDPRLPAAVAASAAQAALIHRRLAALGEDGVATDAAQEEQVGVACNLLGLSAGDRQARPAAALHRLAAALRAGPGKDRLVAPFADWNHLRRLDLACFQIVSGGGTGNPRRQIGDQRGILAAFCETLAASGLGDLPGRWRTGSCRIDRAKPPFALVKAGYGSLLGGGWEAGNAFLIAGHTYSDDATLVEYAPDGVVRGLAACPFTAVEDLPLPTRARLEAWQAALRREPPPPPTAALVDRVTAQVGGERGMVALLLAGLPGLESYEHNFLPKELRERLGLKLAEAVAARDHLNADGQQRAMALVAALVGDDPAGLWQLDQPGPIGRLAAAWKGGATAALPATTRRPAPAELQQACAAALAGTPVFRAGAPELRLAAGRSGAWDITFDRRGEGLAFTADLLAAAWWAAREVHLHQPWDSPSALALSALVPHLDRALDDPGTVLTLGEMYRCDHPLWRRFEQTWDQLGAARGRQVAEGGKEGELRDDGQLVMMRCEDNNALALHPHQVRSEADGARFLALAEPGEEDHRLASWPARLVVAWRSAPWRALLARLGGAGLPPGGRDADPRLSAPATVAAVARRFKLDEDAAAAYLMVLALAEPTDALLRGALGWDEARLEAALAACTARKLLLAARRRGAGRSRFLPGGWEDLKDPYLPLETWKLPLHGGQRRKAALVLPDGPLLPTTSLGALYAAAWARVAAGDAPCYEEVR